MHSFLPEVSQAIKEFRKKRGLTGAQLGAMVQLSQSKIAKLENGYYSRYDTNELERILQALRVPAPLKQKLLANTHSKTSVPRLYYLNALGEMIHYEAHLEREKKLKVVRAFSPSGVQVFFQTLDYRREYLKSIGITSDAITKNLATTLIRQDILLDGKRSFEFIIQKAGLYALFTDVAIHRAQIDRLIRLSYMKNIRIGVLCSLKELPLLDTGPFTICDNKWVIASTAVAELYFVKPEEVLQYQSLFNEIASRAVYGDDARQVLAEVMADLERDEPAA